MEFYNEIETCKGISKNHCQDAIMQQDKMEVDGQHHNAQKKIRESRNHTTEASLRNRGLEDEQDKTKKKRRKSRRKSYQSLSLSNPESIDKREKKEKRRNSRRSRSVSSRKPNDERDKPKKKRGKKRRVKHHKKVNNENEMVPQIRSSSQLDLGTATNRQIFKNCPNHMRSRLEYYCLTDKIMICELCLKDHGQNHDIKEFQVLKDSIDQRFKQIQNDLESRETDAVKKLTERVRDEFQSISSSMTPVEKYIGKSLHRLKEEEVEKTLEKIDSTELAVKELTDKIDTFYFK